MLKKNPLKIFKVNLIQYNLTQNFKENPLEKYIFLKSFVIRSATTYLLYVVPYNRLQVGNTPFFITKQFVHLLIFRNCQTNIILFNQQFSFSKNKSIRNQKKHYIYRYKRWLKDTNMFYCHSPSGLKQKHVLCHTIKHTIHHMRKIGSLCSIKEN